MQKIKNYLFSISSATLDKKDAVTIFLIILIYGVFSFCNLGSMKNPNTFVTNENIGDELVYKVKSNQDNLTLRYFVGPTSGSFNVLTSTDNINYDSVGMALDTNYVFSWHDININSAKGIKYIKIIFNMNDASIGEIGLVENNSSLIGTTDLSKKLLDENNTIPKTISYKNSTYFDEVYFARAAYEYANGIPTYEWVHPPLGKLIQSVPVALFGMTPFNYRLMGNISGILIVVVMYMFGKALFKHRGYGLLAALIMSLDGFHYAQTRMGTIDSHLVLFILLAFYFLYRYLDLLSNTKKQTKKTIMFLLGSGISISCAIGVKWTGLFAGIGLAIIFLTNFYFSYIHKKKKEEIRKRKKEIIDLGIVCFIVFILFPIIIYCLSYFLFPSVSSYKVDNFSSLFKITEGMYNYHSKLDATHPFSSDFYTWPVMLRPVWLYTGNIVNNTRSTISAFGNPAIWWSSAIATVTLLYFAIKKEKKAIFLLIAIFSMYVPYFNVGRCMFLYHYFPILPFTMLSLVYILRKISKREKKKIIIPIFIIIIITMFIYFFPVVSGMVSNNDDLESKKWISSWVF